MSNFQTMNPAINIQKQKIFIRIAMLALVFTTFNLPAQSQTEIDTGKAVPKFKNQGQQEDYWTTEFFKKEYKEQNLNRFRGKIVQADGVFINGLIYPALTGGNHITAIEELPFLSTTCINQK